MILVPAQQGAFERRGGESETRESRQGFFQLIVRLAVRTGAPAIVKQYRAKRSVSFAHEKGGQLANIEIERAATHMAAGAPIGFRPEAAL